MIIFTSIFTVEIEVEMQQSRIYKAKISYFLD